MNPRIGTIAVVIAAFVAVLILGAMTINIVPEGHVGIVTTFGRAEEGVLRPGVHPRWPLIQDVVPLETRVRPVRFERIDAASREYQSVKVSGVLNYRLQEDRADDIYRIVGPAFDDRVIVPAMNDHTKEVMPQYGVSTILPKRDEIRQNIVQAMNRTLGQYGITVTDIYLENIEFSPEYTAAIEAKQVAQQNAEREQQVLEQTKVQAQQAEERAKGEALAQVAKAKGEAESQIEIARGTALANRALAESLTSALIEYLRLQRWDGHLPTTVVGEDNPVLVPIR